MRDIRARFPNFDRSAFGGIGDQTGKPLMHDGSDGRFKLGTSWICSPAGQCDDGWHEFELLYYNVHHQRSEKSSVSLKLNKWVHHLSSSMLSPCFCLIAESSTTAAVPLAGVEASAVGLLLI